MTLQLTEENNAKKVLKKILFYFKRSFSFSFVVFDALLLIHYIILLLLHICCKLFFSHENGTTSSWTSFENIKLYSEILFVQIFESVRSELETVDNADADDDLKRLSQNRCSIAERRRMYESRSISGNPNEKPPQSPLPLV